MRLSPIAFFISTAATVESTPPLNAHIAFEEPILFLISTIDDSIKLEDFQRPLHLQISKRKF